MIPGIVKLIPKRKSHRNYNGQSLPDEKLKEIQYFADNLPEGPFGNRCRFYVISTEIDITNFYKQGTYGFVQGVRNWIIGSVPEEGRKNLEDLGYLMELVILYATHLGVQTCWVGGNFRARYFSNQVKTKPGYIIPAIAALGTALPNDGAIAGLLKWSNQSSKRKPWEKLFFHDNFETPLSPFEAGEYRESLEMLRLSPSTANMQPWRILKEKNRNVFHFFISRNSKFREIHKLLHSYDMQRVDIGVAIGHFTETINSKEIDGGWHLALPQFQYPKKFEHVATWYGQ